MWPLPEPSVIEGRINAPLPLIFASVDERTLLEEMLSLIVILLVLLPETALCQNGDMSLKIAEFFRKELVDASVVQYGIHPLINLFGSELADDGPAGPAIIKVNAKTTLSMLAVIAFACRLNGFMNLTFARCDALIYLDFEGRPTSENRAAPL